MNPYGGAMLNDTAPDQKFDDPTAGSRVPAPDPGTSLALALEAE